MKQHRKISNQFPTKIKGKNTVWALWYQKQKIVHGAYALCVFKKKEMLRTVGGLKKEKFKIIHHETTITK